MARRPTTISIEDQWECRLSASPERVRTGDEVTLTVTLSHPRFDDLSDADKNAIYVQCFSYAYDTTDPRLQPSLAGASDPVISFALPSLPDGAYTINVTVTPNPNIREIMLRIADDPTFGLNRQTLERLPLPEGELIGSATISAVTNLIQTQSSVTLQRTFAGPTNDRALWPTIRNRTAAIGFERYQKFIDCIFCEGPSAGRQNPLADFGAVARNLPNIARCLDPGERPLSIYGPYAYGVLKLATQAFLTLESGVVLREGEQGRPKIFDLAKEQIRQNDFTLTFDKLKSELTAYLGPADQGSVLPYLDRIVRNLVTLDGDNVDEVLPYCHGILQHRLTNPSLTELIWSYWHEEGMLVQTMNAIARRFQNRRASPNDPLGELEFDPLRPLNNLIWGFIQDEHNRLTVPRRAYEYQHHYGLSLMGKAVPNLMPADSRSKFIEGFHSLLSGCARFFKEDSDTTVIADAFPLLNALKEVHLLLAEGAHNQFGDLTWTARTEMLMMQWLLARPEMREFLRGRYMVPYQEDWMGAVDSMKKLQGWTDTTVTHFHELAVTGERILLSIRYGDWVDIENIEDQAKNWARSWKPEIQRYLHGYRTVAGVDLAADLTDSRDAATRFLQPSALLQRRLAEQTSATSLPSSQRAGLVAARVSGRAEMPAPKRAALPIYRKET